MTVPDADTASAVLDAVVQTLIPPGGVLGTSISYVVFDSLASLGLVHFQGGGLSLRAQTGADGSTAGPRDPEANQCGGATRQRHRGGVCLPPQPGHRPGLRPAIHREVPMTSPGTLNEIFFGAIDRYRGYFGRDAGQDRRDVDRLRLPIRAGPGSVPRRRPPRAGPQRPAIELRCCRRTGPSGPGPTYACLASRCADVPIYPTLPATAHRIHPARLGRSGHHRVEPRPAREDPRHQVPRRHSRAAARDRHRPGCDRAGRPLASTM